MVTTFRKLGVYGLGALLLFFPLEGWGKLENKKDPNIQKTAAEKAQEFFGPSTKKVFSLSLKQCIEKALVHNKELQAANLDIEVAHERINEASRLGYPIVEYEYQLAPVPKDVSNAVDDFFSGHLTVFNRAKLGVGVPIHTFGKVKTGKELASLGVEAERQKKVLKEEDIVATIKQLYNGVLLAREVNRLLKTAYDQLTDEMIKREKIEEGGDPSELLKLKLFRAELEKRLEESDKKEILALAAMRVQMGLEPDVRFDLAMDKLRPVVAPLYSYESYRQSALDSRPDLKLLNVGYLAKGKQIDLEKRLMGPILGVGGFFELGRAPSVSGVTAVDDFSNPFNFTRAGLGLQLKGNLDFHTSLSKIHQEEGELHRIRIQKELAGEGVQLEVKDAFLQVRNTKLDMDRAEEAGKLSRQLLFLTQSSYDIGLSDSRDLIDALKSFLETRGQYFEAVFYYNSALAKLDQKTGKTWNKGWEEQP